MSHTFPKTIPSDKPNSEKTVFNLLKNLSAPFYIFYSVFWQSKRRGREGDGEADFTIFDPKRGIIVCEVKGGEITIEEGDWFSTGSKGKNAIKNPFEQAKDSKHALIKYLKDSGLSHISVTHSVAFTSHSDTQSLSTYGPRDIIWYKNDLKDIGSAIDRTFSHWGAKSATTDVDVRKIRDLLAPTVSFRKKLCDAVSGACDEMVALTEQQIIAFRQIRKNRRAIVLGGAGTGKTILAVERAKQLSRDGFKTLLVCYNDLLSAHLKSELANDKLVTAASYHSLCIREARVAGLSLPSKPSQEWWEDAASDFLIAAVTANGTSFDALVIDEAQDFSQSWLDSLLLLCQDAQDPPCYIFMDDRQDLYSRKLSLGEGFISYDLDINCRNTVEIASKVSAIFKEKPVTIGCHGPKPVFCELDVSNDAVEFTQSLISDLLRDELINHQQVVVLSNDASIINKLRNTYVDDHSFTEYGKHGIVCETIRRFKGLESDVIILLLSETCLDTLSKEDIYVALSRPKASLYVAGSNRIKKILSWKS